MRNHLILNEVHADRMKIRPGDLMLLLSNSSVHTRSYLKFPTLSFIPRNASYAPAMLSSCRFITTVQQSNLAQAISFSKRLLITVAQCLPGPQTLHINGYPPPQNDSRRSMLPSDPANTNFDRFDRPADSIDSSTKTGTPEWLGRIVLHFYGPSVPLHGDVLHRSGT